MKNVFIALMGLLFLFNLVAEETNYESFWEKKQVFENNYLKLEVPITWQSLFKTKGIDKVYNLSGRSGLPSSYNGKRVIAASFIWQKNAKNDDEAIRAVLADKASNAMNSFIEPYQVNGHNGWLIHSYFKKYINNLSALRYDFLVYIESIKSYYVVSLLIQYAEDSNDYKKFLTSMNIDSYVDIFLKHLWIK